MNDTNNIALMTSDKLFSKKLPETEREITCCDHPTVPELLAVNDEEKMEAIEYHFSRILQVLGLDLTNDSLTKTPHRFAKMLVKELFTGLKNEEFPTITTQKNSFAYHEMLLETNISIQSVCEHHFMPILGYCHIAYVPNDKIIGLSKLNRIAQYYARRPQVQERMTIQIQKKLEEILGTKNIAVVIDALHLCVRMRGIQDSDSMTRTCIFNGCFQQEKHCRRLLDSIPQLNSVKL